MTLLIWYHFEMFNPGGVKTGSGSGNTWTEINSPEGWTSFMRHLNDAVLEQAQLAAVDKSNASRICITYLHTQEFKA